MSEEGISKTRRKVQEAVERAEAEHRRQLLVKRIELAGSGLKAFRENKPVEAAQAFQTYLRIIEDWKGVAEGNLNPSLFDAKKDAAELLLISGVYWDLVRLYDRTRTQHKKRDFLHYLEKYILFSKGMRHQMLCAETLRKYIATEKAHYREDLKQAYKILAINKCFIATELCDVIAPETVPVLREFRDEQLARHVLGRILVSVYYQIGPVFARALEGRPDWIRLSIAKGLDAVAIRVGRRQKNRESQ